MKLTVDQLGRGEGALVAKRGITGGSSLGRGRKVDWVPINARKDKGTTSGLTPADTRKSPETNGLVLKRSDDVMTLLRTKEGLKRERQEPALVVEFR